MEHSNVKAKKKNIRVKAVLFTNIHLSIIHSSKTTTILKSSYSTEQIAFIYSLEKRTFKSLFTIHPFSPDIITLLLAVIQELQRKIISSHNKHNLMGTCFYYGNSR